MLARGWGLRSVHFPSSAALFASLLLCLPACRDAPARGEAARLRRQIDGLRTALAEGGKESFLSADQLVVGVRQELARDLLQARLPLTTVLWERFSVNLESADVRFESSQSLITIEGRMHALAAPLNVAEFVLAGGLDRIAVDPESGLLTSRVALDRIEVKKVATGNMDPGVARTMVEGLAGQGLGATEGVIPPLEIPMRLDQTIDSRGLHDRVVFVPPGRLALQVTVKQVLPMQGRLWVILAIVRREAS